MDVAEWLRGLGLDQYLPAFRANDIDGEVLRRLTAEDLRELGVASIGHRRRLLDAIATLGPSLTLPRRRGKEIITTLPSPGLSRGSRGREGWGPGRRQSGGS
jgi:SAM domain (Sterile alpha motif)